MASAGEVNVAALPSPAQSPTFYTHRRLEVRVAGALQLALLLLALANLGRIPVLDLGERQAPLLVNDLCLAAVVALGGVAMARARQMWLDNVALAALVFAAIGALSAVSAVPRFGLTPFELIASLAYLARWTAYFALYVVVINCVRAADSGNVWRAMEWCLLAVVAFGIVQSIFLPDFAFIVNPDARKLLDWDPQRHRLVSSILEPNVAAIMIDIVLLVQLSRLATGAQTPLWKPVLLLTGLVLTASRSGVLALMVGSLVVLSAAGMKRRLAQLAAAAGVIALVALPKIIDFARDYGKLGISDGSALARLVVWQRAAATFLENPWFGIGFNTYGFVQKRRGIELLGTAAYSAEGGVLFVAVLTGIVGLGVFMAMVWMLWQRCRAGSRDGRGTPEERALFIGTAASTAAVLVHSLFVNSLFVPFVMELLWVLWGLTFVARADIANRPALRAA